MADLQAILKKHTTLTPKLPAASNPATELQKPQPCVGQSGNQITFLAAAEEIAVLEEHELLNQKVHQYCTAIKAAQASLLPTPCIWGPGTSEKKQGLSCICCSRIILEKKQAKQTEVV